MIVSQIRRFDGWSSTFSNCRASTPAPPTSTSRRSTSPSCAGASPGTPGSPRFRSTSTLTRPIAARVDRVRFERVLGNLLANAEQHAGGAVRIAVEAGRAGVRAGRRRGRRSGRRRRGEGADLRALHPRQRVTPPRGPVSVWLSSPSMPEPSAVRPGSRTDRAAARAVVRLRAARNPVHGGRRVRRQWDRLPGPDRDGGGVPDRRQRPRRGGRRRPPRWPRRADRRDLDATGSDPTTSTMPGPTTTVATETSGSTSSRARSSSPSRCETPGHLAAWQLRLLEEALHPIAPRPVCAPPSLRTDQRIRPQGDRRGDRDARFRAVRRRRRRRPALMIGQIVLSLTD